ncbi:MAG: ABC-F family ATP-binding cassette domain-containing protein [Verrucomicrobia bacterium]|nr:ABC-F family ATP-binding cassette domain-containing protein [Verrucomicrobiota bacterium]MBS0636025.1 ABC-F family ATP-binding cassette domain-containing protein [Verrucomicrobiota bacterium]
MITLDQISMSIPGRTLFEDVSCGFSPGNRYGLTGPNGAGKTTLFGIITGKREPTKGSVAKPKRVGILRQDIHEFLDLTTINVVIQGNTRLWKALQERDRLYEVEMTDEVGIKLGELEMIVAEEDGYMAESNAETLLLGIGVPAQYHHRLMKEIPQDMQFRALLCQALFGEPEALLLDEPTNHLDMTSIGWLEQFLRQYRGTLVVVSHDRHFLNAVTTHIADIDYETVIIYPGNYDDMVETKTAVRDRATEDAKSKEKKIAQLQEFVSKFRSGTRASQVQSRLREMERLQPQEQKKSNIQRPYIRFVPCEKQSGKIVLTAKDIAKAYGNHQVIKGFSFEVHRGDKIAVIGNNGLGKTTLLKMLAGVLPPDHGTVELGHNALISYFAQNHEESIDKKDPSNLFDWLKARKSNVYDTEARSVLGKMLFGGDDAFKRVSNLSGGETARLIIGGMMLADHNLIILDEPNNHLDLEAVSALGWALDEYKGTAIVASHDRDLLDRFAKKLIIFTDKGIEFFDGPLEEYLAVQKSKS